MWNDKCFLLVMIAWTKHKAFGSLNFYFHGCDWGEAIYDGQEELEHQSQPNIAEIIRISLHKIEIRALEMLLSAKYFKMWQRKLANYLPPIEISSTLLYKYHKIRAELWSVDIYWTSTHPKCINIQINHVKPRPGIWSLRKPGFDQIESLR